LQGANSELVADLILLFVFAISLLGFLWPYAFYPFILSVLSSIINNKVVKDANFFPEVTLLVPCFNEENVIRSKLQNSLKIDYPKDLLQILVVDSGSTDRTNQIVSEYTDSKINLIRQTQRCGKGSGINFALKYATGKIIVVTDADAYLNKESLRSILGYFADPQVGVVGGKIFTKNNYDSAETNGTTFLRRFENYLANHESTIDSTVNVGGELLAMRKELAAVDENNLAEDFDCVLNARAMGYRVLYDENATAWEHSPTTYSDIIIQKKRVTIGTIQNLAKYRKMLFSPRFGLFGLLFLPSHKLMQILNCFFLAIVFSSSILLYLLTHDIIVGYFLIFEIVLLIMSCVSWAFKLNKGPFTFLRFFIIIQISLIAGWRDYFSKDYNVRWDKINSKRLPLEQN
jgi:cellulose synthase/poly-beta-1,6-N-acetylglucosamine synthase-like glycosyltransferase